MRLFLALDLSEGAREELARFRSALEPHCSGWRWVRTPGIHLTVRFLGEVVPGRDRELRAGWRALAQGLPPFRFLLSGAGRFPPRGRPRVLWVGVRDEPARVLERLADEAEQLARRCGFEPRQRPFKPHLTLARADRRGVATVRNPLPQPRESPTEARALVLFESKLGPGGARYTALEEFRFLAAPCPRA